MLTFNIIGCLDPIENLEDLSAHEHDFIVYNKTGYDSVYVEIYIDDYFDSTDSEKSPSASFFINNNENKNIGSRYPELSINIIANVTGFDNNGNKIYLYDKAKLDLLQTYEDRRRGWRVYLNPEDITLKPGYQL